LNINKIKALKIILQFVPKLYFSLTPTESFGVNLFVVIVALQKNVPSFIKVIFPVPISQLEVMLQ